MTDNENRALEPQTDRAVSYIAPEVVDYGDAAALTKTINGSVNNDGGSTPPNVYVS